MRVKSLVGRLSFAVASLLAVAPASWGTTINGVLTNAMVGVSSYTFSSIAGSGVDLTVSCTDIANSCLLADDGTTPFGAGVTTTADAVTTVDHNQSLVFSFSSGGNPVPITIVDVVFTLPSNPNNNKYDFSTCTAVPALVSASPCAGGTTLVANGAVSSATSTVTISMPANTGSIFQFDGPNPNSAWGISEIDFTIGTPEPATWGLVGFSLLGLAAWHRRGKRGPRTS